MSCDFATIDTLTLYENIVIGNYLFDLRVRMAKRRPDLPLVSVNMLQQTPSDRLLGDVLLANAGVCRLMEFKRAGKLTDKERKKLATLRSGIAASGTRREEIENLSRELHWYVEIQEPRAPLYELVTKACAYLDFPDDPNFIGMNQFFAEEIADEACQEGSDLRLRETRGLYLKWICQLFASIDAKDESASGTVSKRNSSPGAFLVALNQKGEAYWLAVPSVEYVFMNSYELSEKLGFDIPRHEQTIKYENGEGFRLLVTRRGAWESGRCSSSASHLSRSAF